MLHLSRHIESLLLQHHCVIIPEFGGFITQYVAARYIEAEGVFLPPYRSVKFNRHLVVNDGMLVQSYMSAYGIGYSEAAARVQLAVSEMKSALLREGKYDLHGVGTLYLKADGVYTFEANEAGTLAPELYGLDAVQTKSHLVAQTDSPDAIIAKSTIVSTAADARYYTIRLRREVVNYVAAAIVMLVCYFAWSVPVSNTADTHLRQAAFFATDVFSAPNQTETQLSPRIVTEDEVALEQVELLAEMSVETPTQPVASIPPAAATYTVVVCSQVPRVNAERLVDKLSKEGHDASIFSKQGILRVVIGSYDSEEQAAQALRSLRKSAQGFEEAWVLKK